MRNLFEVTLTVYQNLIACFYGSKVTTIPKMNHLLILFIESYKMAPKSNFRKKNML